MVPTSKNQLYEAKLYVKESHKKVLCQLCPHYCKIEDGKKGICQVRENRGGKLYSLVYGKSIVQHVNSIEKKPLYHFYPGSKTYSIATEGCNFNCKYCLNWELSQNKLEKIQLTKYENTPKMVHLKALESGCKSVAFTYVEPTIFFEYAYDICLLNHEAGLMNVFKSNGFMSREMLELMLPLLDAVNIDIKSFRDSSYRQFGGRLQPVLDSLKWMKQSKIWIEISTLLVPGINDSAAEIRDIANFIFTELGEDTPWHILRFFPAYKMSDVPPTPLETLELTKQIGRSVGLNYIYFSNLIQKGQQDTFCPACNHLILQRTGHRLQKKNINGNTCPNCNYSIAGEGL